MEGSKSQIVPNISCTRTRTFDINLKAKLTIKIDNLCGD